MKYHNLKHQNIRKFIHHIHHRPLWGGIVNHSIYNQTYPLKMYLKLNYICAVKLAPLDFDILSFIPSNIHTGKTENRLKKIN